MNLNLVPAEVDGLGLKEQEQLQELLEVHEYHINKNIQKARYYEGKIALSEVNLGIALPKGMQGLEIGCNWGAKTVDVLASRSMFDGFVDINGAGIPELDRITAANRLEAQYSRACRDELLYGCTLATLSADPVAGCKIRFHSLETAAALWDGDKGRISCGMAIIDTLPDDSEETTWIPSIVNLYTDNAIWVLTRDQYKWSAARMPHKMGRPLMEALVWNATSKKPFGRSRIKEPIRRLIQGYVRTVANASIGLEFSTAPQKYLLGVTDDQYDAVINDKFRQYVGNLLAATTNPETGQNPVFGQLTQGTIEPHISMMRLLATQFSAATGLTVTDTGVVSEANPTSSDAILAQSMTLVSMAEELNKGNGDALRTIAQMALAVANNLSLDQLSEEQLGVMAHFKNPAMPSVAVSADAAIKIASARQGFAQTDTFLEMIGFSPADIRRIKSQEQRAQGAAILEGLGL